MSAVVPIPTIEGHIAALRGQRVMLSHHLAELYRVEPRALVQAVKRNRDRFPGDFMFQLTWREVAALRSQSVILKRGHNVKYRPYAFTEQGVAMLSSVLRSRRAIQVNIEIMRAFVRIRAMAADHQELLERLDALERRYDARFKAVFEAIRKLMEPLAKGTHRPIGFRPSSAGGRRTHLGRRSW